MRASIEKGDRIDNGYDSCSKANRGGCRLTVLTRSHGVRCSRPCWCAKLRPQLRPPRTRCRIPLPNGNNGTTIDPLQYNCGNDAPTCGQVGESNGYYNGTNVDLLYSENYYCDANVTSAATTGCEVGRRPVTHPECHLGRQLGHLTGEHHPRRHPLYPCPALQQSAADPVHGDGDLHRPPADHRPVTHRGRPARAAPRRAACRTSPSLRTTTSSGRATAGVPEWWNVEVVATTDPATFNTLTSVNAINAAVTAGTAITAPDQRLPVLPDSARHVVGVHGGQPDRDRSSGSGCAGGSGRTAGEPGRARNDLQQPDERLRGHGAELPERRHQPRLDRTDRTSRRSTREQYYCGTTSVAVHSSSGCEAGSDPTSVPPGVADTDPADSDRDQRPDRPAVHPGPALCQPTGALCPVPGRQSRASTTRRPSTCRNWRPCWVLRPHRWRTSALARTRPPADHPQR